jgi:hypothetical protein
VFWPIRSGRRAEERIALRITSFPWNKIPVLVQEDVVGAVELAGGSGGLIDRFGDHGGGACVSKTGAAIGAAKLLIG